MVNVELQVNFVRCIGLQKNVQWLDGGALHQAKSNFSTSLHIVLTLWTDWKQTQMYKEAGCKMCREEAMCAKCARCVQGVGANVQEGGQYILCFDFRCLAFSVLDFIFCERGNQCVPNVQDVSRE